MNDYLRPELVSIAFDQYQRYRIVAEVLDRLREPDQAFDILEVGGHPGLIRKFLESDRIIVADMVTGGESLDMLSTAESLPFPDNSFPVVLAVDVLEHIVPEARPKAIAEIARVAKDILILAAPFDYALSRGAEKLVYDFIKEWLGYEHKFLKDHLENPAPNLVETESLLVSLGFDTVIIPNGELERWLVMMLGYYYFDGFPSAMELRKEITSFYNRNYFWMDVAEPAYRHVIVATRKRMREKPAALSDIIDKKVQYPEPDYERMRLWLELFMQGETRRLMERITSLEQQLAEKNTETAHQKKYIEELEDFHSKVKATVPYKIYEALLKRK